uniref:RNA-directed DNA polymerase n=1 Tax=Lygus hesperus TaxID=30085 RepID=A0A146MBF8_LYGHE
MEDDVLTYRVTPTPSLVLRGSVNGVACDFIVDTGATRTIMSLEILNHSGMKMNDTRPAFIRSISGERLPVKGEATVLLDFGNGISRTQNVLVACIKDECILGLDFLIAQHCLIDLSNQAVMIGGQQVKAVKQWEAAVAEVTDDGSEDFQELFEVDRAIHGRASDGDCAPHLQVLQEEAMQQLSTEQMKFVVELFNDFEDIFARNSADIGRVKDFAHTIDVGTSAPIRQSPRRIPPHRLEEVEKMVTEMETNGVIEPSSSPWASPIVLVKKKDGSTRFCIDYRKLNSVTKRDSHPMPRISDLVGALEGSSWFSTLDLQSGYWQVPMMPQDKEKTAFCTPRGLWQFKVMPFGLCNAPSTFQRAMSGILRNEIRAGRVKVYLDDVLVDNGTFEDHVIWLRRVFKVIREAGIKLNPKKCKLFQREVGYLGVVVSKDGITTDPGTTKRVLQWPQPTSVKELQSFLSLCSYYRTFIPQFAKRATALYALQNLKTDFKWDADADLAFADIKAALTQPPVLGHPVPGAKFVLDTDASDKALGAVLSQIQDGREVVLAYYSKCLSKAERNYCVTRKELLGLVNALRHFDSFGLTSGEPFIVRTDHASLQWLQNFREPDGQLARWSNIIAPYNFKVCHRPGQQHQNADALSRRPCADSGCRYCQRQEDKEKDVEIRLSRVMGDENWQALQKNDVDIGPVYEWVENGRKPTWQDVVSCGTVTKGLWAMLDTLALSNGLLVRKWENNNGTKVREQVVVPKERRYDVLKRAHDFGHFGRRRTLNEARLRYYWPGMTKDVRMICAACEVCGRRGRGKPNAKAPMQIYVTGSPFERICVDTIGPLPVTQRGNRHVVVAIDPFTKWPEAFPVPDIQATTVARGLVDCVFSRFGIPRELHTDQGTTFEADVFKEMLTVLGISKTRTSPMRPQSDGQVERFNRTLWQMLSKVVDDHQKDWDLCLSSVLLAYRGTVHTATGLSPAAMTLGRELVLPVHLLTGPAPGFKTRTEYASFLNTQLQEAHQLARRKLLIAAEECKRRYDVRATVPQLKVGDDVWYYMPRRRVGICPKLQSPWVGPCRVLKRISDVVFRVKLPSGKKRVVHVDKLTAYFKQEEVGEDGVVTDT